MSTQSAALSASGGRACNEDSWGEGDGCWVVADGLGGHGGGEVAARIAREHVLGAISGKPLPSAEALQDAILGANRAILAEQEREPRLERMRTTIVVLCSDGQQALWAHVGDTRLYHLRDGRILSQTEDHSVPQALARIGDIKASEIRFHEDRNRLLRTLGGDAEARPTVTDVPMALRQRDAFLLCTDGFWEYLTEPEMEITLAKAADARGWLEAMEKRLLVRAEGEFDNYTALAVWVG